MPPKSLSGVTIRIERRLFLSSLGILIRAALEQNNAVVHEANHPIEYTITWEPCTQASILVVIDESTAFRKHAEEMVLQYPGRRIIYIVQDLENIDQELVAIQTSISCLIMETHSAEDTTDWIVQLVHDTGPDVKHVLTPRVYSGLGATDSWRRILLQLHRVSEPIVTAIIKLYPTMQSLVNAYSKSDDPEKLLVGIQVSGNRKIGVAISRRIHCIFTSDNPKCMINVETVRF
jgi:hypothetical protein